MIAGAFLLPQMNAYAYSTSDAELEPYRDNSVINDLGFDLPTFKYKVLDFIIADAQDLSEISKVMSESFTTILNDFKDIMLYVIKYAVPIMGLLLAITIGIKAYKHITGVDDELDAANANTDEFLDEYYDWLDSHPDY